MNLIMNEEKRTWKWKSNYTFNALLYIKLFGDVSD